jgi:hypothetical protein
MATLAHAPPIRRTSNELLRQVTWWALAFPFVMVWALVTHNLPLLNWVHVLAGALWTGADILLGFIIGPVMRRLDIDQRTAVVTYLVPRTVLYFFCVSLTTGTAGWFLVAWLGMLTPGSAQFPWVIGALVLVTLMTIQGLGIMTPNSLRIWFELGKPEPRRDLIVGLNRINLFVAGIQGAMQIAIIVIMAHFVVP